MSVRDDTSDDSGSVTEWQTVEQRLYEPGSGPELTTVVIEAVAAAEEAEILGIEQPPLYEAVDIDAVKNSLFDATDPDTSGVTGNSLSFEYRGYRITVHGDGWVHVATPVD